MTATLHLRLGKMLLQRAHSERGVAPERIPSGSSLNSLSLEDSQMSWNTRYIYVESGGFAADLVLG